MRKKTKTKNQKTSDTPETDAAADCYLGAALSTDPEQMTVPVALSRKLERERDAALKLAERYRIEANAIMLQRDEARHEIEGWRNKWNCAVEIAARERDAAREQNIKLRDIVERAIGGANSNTKLDVLTDEERRKHESTLERLAIRAALISRKMPLLKKSLNLGS
jgi:hypothetical protein